MTDHGITVSALVFRVCMALTVRAHTLLRTNALLEVIFRIVPYETWLKSNAALEPRAQRIPWLGEDGISQATHF